MIARMLTSKNYHNVNMFCLFILIAGFYFIILIFRYIISIFKSIFFQTSIEEELNNDFGNFPWTNSKKITSPRKRTITLDNSNETDECIELSNINNNY
jgi:hypothetical protein